MLVQQRPSWTCKNPRCTEQIEFGSYCPACIKLVIGKKLPDSIICKKCSKEVKVRNLTNDLKRKKQYCDDCYKILNRARALIHYYDIKRKTNLNSFLKGNV
uniref:ORF30 n=1 Tax=Nitrosopumilaceae spindle-shaped virus TaxID=3065433 RepID=A0AAT9J964_9VIRU